MNLGDYGLYEYIRDFSGPSLIVVQNIILGVTAWYALSSIKSARENAEKQILNQEEIAKRRATLDLVLNMGADVTFQNARQAVARMRINDISPTSVFDVIKDKNTSVEARTIALENYKSCQIVLNKLSLFAVGIRTCVLDEDTFKNYYYSTFVEMVEFLRTFIHEIRKVAKKQIENRHFVTQDTIYQEVLWLLDHWRANPLHRIEK